MVKKADFGSMFATNTAKTKKKAPIKTETVSKNANGNSVIELDTKMCSNWTFSDRQEFELGDLRELGQDIVKNGQAQPIIVRRKDGNQFEVIAGERRWRACALFNIKVKAIIVDATDEECFSIQNSENIKTDISPYSKSKNYFKIINELGITQNKLAEKLNVKKSTFSELLSFNYVDDAIWNAVEDMRKVSVNTASYMRKLINEDKKNISKLIKIADKIRRGVGRSAIAKALENKKQLDNEIKNKYFTIRNSNIKINNKYFHAIDMRELEKSIFTFFEKKLAKDTFKK